MPALGQARDLPQTQPSAWRPHPLVGERVLDPSPVDEEPIHLEAVLRHRTPALLAIGEDVEPLGDEALEEPGAPPPAVEDHRDAPLTDERADLVEHDGQHLDQAGIGLGRDDEQRFARRVVHPVVGCGRHRQAHARNVGLGKRALAVVDPDMAVHIQEAHRRPSRGYAPYGQGPAKLGSAPRRRQARELAPKRLHLRSTVESQDAAKILG